MRVLKKVLASVSEWKLYMLLFLIFASLTFAVNYERSLHLDFLWNLDESDTRLSDQVNVIIRDHYKIYTIVSAIISSGVSPYDTRAFWFKGDSAVPVIRAHYAGYLTLNAIIIRLTGLSPLIVGYTVTPFLFAVSLPLIILFFGKIMGWNRQQTTFLFLLYGFINDYVIYLLPFAKGEWFGLTVGLIGVAFFLKQKYANAILPLSVAISLGVENVIFIFILFLFLVLSAVSASIKRKGSTVLLSAEVFFKKNNKKAFLPLIVAGLVFIAFVYPLTQSFVIYWSEPPKPSPGPSTPPSPDIVVTPPPGSSVPVNTSGVIPELVRSTQAYEVYFLPTSFRSLLLTLAYPITHPYWSRTSRNALAPISALLKLNLTDYAVESLSRFMLTVDTLPFVAILLLFSTGLPIIFLATLFVLRKTKSADDLKLFLAAFAIPIGFALFYYIFRWSIFPDRTMQCVVLFFSIILAKFHSVLLKLRIAKIGFLAISLLMVVRIILWVWMLLTPLVW